MAASFKNDRKSSFASTMKDPAPCFYMSKCYFKDDPKKCPRAHVHPDYCAIGAFCETDCGLKHNEGLRAKILVATLQTLREHGPSAPSTPSAPKPSETSALERKIETLEKEGKIDSTLALELLSLISMPNGALEVARRLEKINDRKIAHTEKMEEKVHDTRERITLAEIDSETKIGIKRLEESGKTDRAELKYDAHVTSKYIEEGARTVRTAIREGAKTQRIRLTHETVVDGQFMIDYLTPEMMTSDALSRGKINPLALSEIRNGDFSYIKPDLVNKLVFNPGENRVEVLE